MSFFESMGIKLKVEHGGRVFPMSDKSSDIIKQNKKIIELVTSIDSRLNAYVK